MWKINDDNTLPLITAKKHIESSHNNGKNLTLPKTAILFYLHGGVEYLNSNYNTTLVTEKLPRFLNGCPVYQLNENICFLDGGRGAPMAVDTLETLVALGVKNIVSVGLMGAIDANLIVGDKVVVSKAFVEEGTTLHYYGNLEYSLPCEALSLQLQQLLNAKYLPVVSTDAVYRQTAMKEQLWRGKGAVGVDMETSALMSVGKYLGANVASVLMVSDVHNTANANWQWKLTKGMRQKYFEDIANAVAKLF